MSAVHGIEYPLETMDGPRFFRFAERLPAYPGVLRLRIEAEVQRDGGGVQAPAGREGETEVPLAAAMALHGDLIERGQG